jgi:hypothetical protein
MMNRRNFVFIALAASLPAGAAFADPTSRSVPVAGITGVDVRIGADLTITQGDQESLVLSSDASLDDINAFVANGSLIIERSSKSSSFFSRTSKVNVKLTVKTLEKLIIEGGGDVKVGPLKTPRMELSISGSANVRLEDLRSEALEILVSGRGDVTVSGATTGVVVRISGSGNAHLAHLESSAAKVVISGKGDVDLAVKDRLDAHINGMGNVHYAGNPQVTRTISGLGDVSPMK